MKKIEPPYWIDNFEKYKSHYFEKINLQYIELFLSEKNEKIEFTNWRCNFHNQKLLCSI